MKCIIEFDLKQTGNKYIPFHNKIILNAKTTEIVVPKELENSLQVAIKKANDTTFNASTKESFKELLLKWCKKNYPAWLGSLEITIKCIYKIKDIVMKKEINLVVEYNDQKKSYLFTLPTEDEFSLGDKNWVQDVFEKFSKMEIKQPSNNVETIEQNKILTDLENVWDELNLIKLLPELHFSFDKIKDDIYYCYFSQRKEILEWKIREIKSINSQVLGGLKKYLHPTEGMKDFLTKEEL